MIESPSFNQVQDYQSNSIEMQLQHWFKYEIFTFQFWFLIVILILPWFIWWKLVDKKRILEILVYGLIVVTIVTLIDEIGSQLNLWDYYIDIEPLFPRLIPMNFTLLPISYMLVYQHFPKWKTFILANIVFAVFAAFIGEPIFAHFHIYALLHWKYIFSFPLYIIIAVIFKLTISLIMKAYQRALLI